MGGTKFFFYSETCEKIPKVSMMTTRGTKRKEKKRMMIMFNLKMPLRDKNEQKKREKRKGMKKQTLSSMTILN